MKLDEIVQENTIYSGSQKTDEETVIEKPITPSEVKLKSSPKLSSFQQMMVANKTSEFFFRLEKNKHPINFNLAYKTVQNFR